jgi:calcineurin-like phosphoesterase family protein
MHRGAVHLHGHLHGGTSGMERYRCVDVGMDSTGAIAITMDEVVRLGLKGAIKEHH